MPGHLRTGGYLRHVQPMALRDGITEWARTFFQEEDRVFKYPFLKRRTRSTASWRLSLRDTPAYTVDGSIKHFRVYWAVVRAYLFDFVYWPFLSYTIAPGLFGGRGEMAMADP